MNRKSIFFAILCFTLFSASYQVKAEWLNSLPDWTQFDTENITEISNNLARYLGYITAVILLEQGYEYCISLYNKHNSNHAIKFREAVLNSSLNKNNPLNHEEKSSLVKMSSEFRNPFYRYTFGYFLKNRIEKWLDSEIQKKSNNQNYKINENDLNNQLLFGSY